MIWVAAETETGMTLQIYKTTFTVDRSPGETFDTIIDVKRWWSEEIEGAADQVGNIFSYQFEDLHRCKVRVDELVRGQKVVWTFVDSYFSFTSNPAEWTGTRIIFDIEAENGRTHVTFSHIGLVPHFERGLLGWLVHLNDWMTERSATCLNDLG